MLPDDKIKYKKVGFIIYKIRVAKTLNKIMKTKYIIILAVIVIIIITGIFLLKQPKTPAPNGEGATGGQLPSGGNGAGLPSGGTRGPSGGETSQENDAKNSHKSSQFAD